MANSTFKRSSSSVDTSGCQVVGVVEMQAKFSGMVKGTPKQIAKALKAEMNIEKREVIQRTPKLTGALRDSIEVLEPVIEGREVSCQMTAGDDDVNYAVVVHENLEVDHPVGQAKYMESVLNESGPHMADRLARRLSMNKLWNGDNGSGEDD